MDGGNLLLFKQLDNERRRQLIDVEQLYNAFRLAQEELGHRFAGHMVWKKIRHYEYLYRRHGKVENSLGTRNDRTEAIRLAFDSGKVAAQERVATLRKRLEDMAPVNRALGIARVPRVVARILRRLDERNVLGEQVCVLGTNALFAYEARSGIRFESGLLATADIDLALDARRSLALAARSLPKGLLGLLQEADGTFKLRMKGDYRAINSAGFLVELITPAPKNPMRASTKRHLGPTDSADNDLTAAEIWKLQWVVEAPRFEATVIDDDGLPARIVAVDPRWFAAHKVWLSMRVDREIVKRSRDEEQARAVAAMIGKFFQQFDLTDAALSQLPLDLRASLRKLSSPDLHNQEKMEW